MEKSVMISVDFKNNKVNYDFFEGENAYVDAWNFREGLKDDFGEHWSFRIIKYGGAEVALD